MMKKLRGVVVGAAVAAFLAVAAATTSPSSPILTCTLHPGRLGERQGAACSLSGGGTTATRHHSNLLLLVPLPRTVGPDNAWLAGAAVAGVGGIVACGSGEAPLAGSGVPGCPALGGGGGRNATSSTAARLLAACLPPAAVAAPARFYLTTPLSSTCTDEAVAGRAEPVLLAVAATPDSAFFTFALRARLPRALPASWLGGPVAVSFPPPVLVAVGSPGELEVLAVAGAGGEWAVPAPGGRGAAVVGAVNCAATLAATAAVVRAVVSSRRGPGVLLTNKNE